MCLPIDCWLCTPRTDDDHYHAPPTKPPAPATRGQPTHRNGNGGHHGNGNGGGYYNGNGNGNGYSAHGAVPAGAEADRKASNDVRGTGHHAGAAGARGWHGHAATGAQEKVATAAAYTYAGADETLKQQPHAAFNGRVAADGARDVAHGYYYPAAHRDDAVDSYYPAAKHESPSEALGRE